MKISHYFYCSNNVNSLTDTKISMSPKRKLTKKDLLYLNKKILYFYIENKSLQCRERTNKY